MSSQRLINYRNCQWFFLLCIILIITSACALPVEKPNDHKQCPTIYDADWFISLAVLPEKFLSDHNQKKKLEIILLKVEEALLQFQRFKVLETRKREILLEELRQSVGPMIDVKKALRLRKIKPVECILFINVHEDIKKNLTHITGRLTDIETWTSIVSISHSANLDNITDINTICQKLVQDLIKDYPSAQGQVIGVNQDKIKVDIGDHHHVKPDMKIKILKVGKNIIHPITGKVQGPNTRVIGEAQIVQVYKDMSDAIIVKADQSIQIGDCVYTR